MLLLALETLLPKENHAVNLVASSDSVFNQRPGKRKNNNIIKRGDLEISIWFQVVHVVKRIISDTKLMIYFNDF